MSPPGAEKAQNSQMPITRAMRVVPAELKSNFDDMESPAAPTDCRVATKPPAATPPPFAIADKDIILAAREEAAIPVPVKPTALNTVGTAATVMAPPSTAAAALAAVGPTAKTEAGHADRMVPMFSAPTEDPSADAPEPRAVWANRLSPREPARMVPETAPPALAMATEAVILETREAIRTPVPNNAMERFQTRPTPRDARQQ